MSIFKAYDIRGTVPDELHPELARSIGRAFAEFIGAESGRGGAGAAGPAAPAVAVGRDMRVHSEPLAAALTDGLRTGGVDVVDIGLVTTPTIYYAVAQHGLQGGVMVTASHNPGRYNGMKLCRAEARPISETSGIRDLERMVREGRFREHPSGNGGLRRLDVKAAYLDHLLAQAGHIGPLKVAVDAGNGAAGVLLPALFERLSTRFFPLYLEPDGNFPNHEANPIKAETLTELRRVVGTEGADLGVAFDGDGDRVAFVDETGAIIGCDIMTALLAPRMLSRRPGAAVIYDLRSSRVVREEIERHGGRPVRERVGHSFIKETMRAQEAVFGGELSGHYYFRDHFFADSGLLAMLHVLALLSDGHKPLSRRVAPLRRYHQSGEINFELEDKQGAMDLLAERFADAQISRLDGVTVEYADWWFNVRASNTEPLLRLNLEASTPDGLQRSLNQVRRTLGV